MYWLSLTVISKKKATLSENLDKIFTNTNQGINMAISYKASEYNQIIEKLGCSTDETRKLLKKLEKNEFLRKINFYGANITLILTIVISINTQSGLFIIGILGMPVGALTSLFLRSKADSLRSLLDNEIFNNFLIKNVKIFYQNDDISNIKYTQMEQISVKVTHTRNEHQAIIELAFAAYEKNATGIIITDSNQSNVVTSTINNKAGATAITQTFHSASAMLIKDISVNTNKEFDLEYWYDLFEKGAISENEYNRKKETILKNDL